MRQFSLAFLLNTFVLLAVGPSNGPGAVSVSPAFGSGDANLITAVFSHPGGWSSLGVVNLLVNSALDGRNACYLAYDVPSNRIYLVQDDGNLYPVGYAPGTPNGVLSNSQCLIDVSRSSAQGLNEALKLIVNVTYRPGFAGNKALWAAAGTPSGATSGWQALGTWSVPVITGTIQATGFDPGKIDNASQVSTATFEHQQGASLIETVNILINNALDGRSACYVAFLPQSNTLYLVSDDGNDLSAPLTLGSTSNVQNGQCIVNGSQSSSAVAGTRLTVTLNITLKSAFQGNKVVWTAARNPSVNSQWQAKGTWGNNPIGGPPAASGCSPAVYAYSYIVHQSDLRVYGESATDLNYCAALYYNVLTAGSLYQDGQGPTYEFLAFSGVSAGGSLRSVYPQQGPSFELETDHYLQAFWTISSASGNGSVTYNFYNTFGYTSAGGPTYFPGQASYPFGPPTFIPLFVVSEWIYLGTTVVTLDTADQTPEIYSITPSLLDAGQNQTVVITGDQFGVNPSLNIDPPDDIATSIVAASNNSITANVFVGPNAQVGGRSLAVVSAGLSGLGFLQGPGRKSVSNGAQVTIRNGSTGCTITLTNHQQKYSLLPSRGYRQAEIPLRAESDCTGTVSWQLTFTYYTSGNNGRTISPTIFPPSDRLWSPNEAGSLLLITPTGVGGYADIVATVTVPGASSQRIVGRLFVDGVVIPEGTIKNRLASLYQGPGRTPALMMGLARQETGAQQFGYFGNEFPLFGRVGRWPFQSYRDSFPYGGGSHIGIMQPDASMAMAYDWELNTGYGVAFFLGQKMTFANNYEARMRTKFTGLPELTVTQKESNALVYYGPGSVPAILPCSACPDGITGPYWVPNRARTGWVVNDKNPEGIKYVNEVRSKAY